QLAAPELPKLIDELPVHRRIRRANAVHIDALEHGSLIDGSRRFAGTVAGYTRTQVLWAHSPVCLAVPARCVVDSQQNNRRAGSFDAAQKLLTCGPLAWRIKLIPDGPAECLIHLFNTR